MTQQKVRATKREREVYHNLSKDRRQFNTSNASNNEVSQLQAAYWSLKLIKGQRKVSHASRKSAFMVGDSFKKQLCNYYLIIVTNSYLFT